MAKNRAKKRAKKVRTLAVRAVPAKQAKKVKAGEIVITKSTDTTTPKLF